MKRIVGNLYSFQKPLGEIIDNLLIMLRKESLEILYTFKKPLWWIIGRMAMAEEKNIEVKAKRSYVRDQCSVAKLLPFFGDRFLKDISPALVEAYKQKRLGEPSYRKHATTPATVNREVTCFQVIFNKAVKNGKAEANPVNGELLKGEQQTRSAIIQ
jgi:hypothetical protein